VAWQQLTLHIDASELARTEALLKLAGAESVAVSDDGDDPILEPEPGTTPLWPRLKLRALFAANLDLSALDGVLGPVASTGAATLERIDDEALARAMQQSVPSQRIGPRLTIVPAEAFRADDNSRTGDTRIGLHIGLAFGTGQHPTTRLCLEWLERELADCATVLDFGCGTGVLALAALGLGAGQATAVDNDPQALTAARHNAALNRLEARIRIAPPAALGAERFDLILANILAQPLIDRAEELAGRQDSGGRIVLSGILSAQLDAVESAYRPWYTSLARRELDGWGLLTGLRRQSYDAG